MIKKPLNESTKLSCVAFASITWQIIYILFATITNFRDWVIVHILSGGSCLSCQPQENISIIIVMILPLALGSIGIGYATANSLHKEAGIVKVVIGLFATVSTLAISFFAFGLVDFGINFGR